MLADAHVVRMFLAILKGLPHSADAAVRISYHVITDFTPSTSIRCACVLIHFSEGKVDICSSQLMVTVRK